MRVLGLMVASFEAVPYAQFHTRVLQKEILRSVVADVSGTPDREIVSAVSLDSDHDG